MSKTIRLRSQTLLMLLLIAGSMVYAQTKTVIGTVTGADDRLPLPGVTVVIEGTMQGAVTDIDGKYSLEVTPEQSLTFSFVGFQSQTILVGEQQIINVSLQTTSFDIEEVVVIGYGEAKVKDLTSSITTVRSEDLAKTPAGQAMQALQGKVAGMQVVSSGSPGSSPTVRIRGVGSYPGIGNTDPLYVVDGVFYDNIDFLNSADIASISVLKDASAAAIYGVRAANGVVLIETKSGTHNQKAEIVYDGYYGYQVAQNVLKMANSEQFTNMANESGSEPAAQYILNAMQRYGRSRVNPNVPDVSTDWYDEVLRPAATQNHSLTVAGGSENATYSLATSYFTQDGILDMKNDYERLNLRSKVDYKVNDWFTMGGNMIFSDATRFLEEESAWSQAYWAVPIMPVIDEQNVNAWPVKYSNARDLGYRDGQNPFPTMDFNEKRHKIRKVMANFYLQTQLIPEKLSFKTTYNHAFTSLNIRETGLPYYLDDNVKRTEEESFILRKTETYSDQTWDNVLTYTDSFGQHNLTVMGGSSFMDESFEMLQAKGLDFPYQQEEAWYIDKAKNKPENDVKDDGRRQYSMSYFGRVSYNYMSKYLVYGTFRADGTSKYQETWGYFPTVGVGWVLSEENFWPQNNVVDYLKLRGSWGELGNNSIAASDGARTSEIIYLSLDDTRTAGTKTSDDFAYLNWEVTEETNVGLTARLFRNRMALDADYYVRDTKDAVIPVQVPLIGTTVRRSQGVIRNSGLEVALNWSEQLPNGLSYNIGANISTLKNEVRDLYGQSYVDGGSAEFRQRSIVGEPLLAYYGLEVVGVYQNEAQIQADPVAVANNLEPGDFIYKHQNDDGVIDEDDRVVLGSYLPKLMYGFNFGLMYKNWELSANMMGQSGNKILNRKRGEVIWTPDLNMDADLAINRWHGEGTSNKYPSSKGMRKGWNQKMSSYFVEDGWFFRIQNVQLAYNLKNKEFLGAQMPNARISLTAERPLTVFDYNGFNPEVQDGYDRQTYPIPAVYTLGLNIKF